MRRLIIFEFLVNSLMKKRAGSPYKISSIAESHRLMNLPVPSHPLISVINYNDVKIIVDVTPGIVMHETYLITVKNGFTGSIRYGQERYEFDEGETMSFLAPRQIVSPIQTHPRSGYMLFVHPDFLRGYSLEERMRNYGFFSYRTNQALQVSGNEANRVKSMMENIREECEEKTDDYNHNIIVSYLEVILNLAERFYNRRFTNEKKPNQRLLTQFEKCLNTSLYSSTTSPVSLPTVLSIAQQLNVSPGHLSYLLRKLTGKNAQEHIHECLVGKAKELLSGKSDSISEIAYQLGFGHPQSFSNFFREKTDQTPTDFRRSFSI